MIPTKAKQTTAAYFLFYICIGLILSSLGPSLPILAAQTESTLAQIGVLFTALSLGRILGALTLGRVFDHRPGHPTMGVCLAAVAVLLAAAPLLPSLTLLLAAFFIIGVAWGGLDVATNTLLAWVWGRRSGQFLSALHLFFGVGAILAPFIVNVSIQWNGQVRLAYWLFAFLLVLDAVWVLLLPSPAVQTQAGGRQRQSGQNAFIALVVLLILICIGEEVAFSGWIFTYLRVNELAAQNQAILITSLFWVALSIGRLVAMGASTRVSPQKILLLDLAGCVLASGLILLWPLNRAAVWGGALLLGFFIASVFPMMIVFTQQRVPLTGRITGLLMLGDGVGGMIFPWLAGYLFETFSPTIMILQIFLAFVLAFLLFSRLAVAHQQLRPPVRTAQP